ncbi:CHAD domain-containing protein [Streptomyces anandii]|uniref:CHAD domain-containing protein n=1 Tax=Streptomyces anandii TaxID=285454 RepID=UPI00167461A4|nr:CHAD domain-containing protein [Streptomyces anandii]GGX87845.1 CHAD domain-containing protein [Streptomyces anandii JCM 4720]
MAQRHPDPTDTTAGPVPADALAGYLRAQATEFLRALRLHGESGTVESVDAARALRRSARRISGSLHTFQPLLEENWAEDLRPELAWLSGTLAREHAHQARLDRLLQALHRLSGTTTPPTVPTQSPTPALDGTAAGLVRTGADRGNPGPTRGSANADHGNSGPDHDNSGPRRGNLGAGHSNSAPARGSLAVGAVKAGALLDRQLTLARTRAHSTALQALGSSRFHAVADKVAVLASDVPLGPAAAGADLRPLAAAAEERLTAAVAALPLVTAGSPYNAEALVHGLSPDPAPHPQDAPWHQVRLLLRLHRYAREVLHGAPAAVGVRLLAAGQALDRHRDAAEAAAAAASAARTPRIAPATAYALGVLHADQRHEVEAARYAFHLSWRKQAVGAN